MSALVGAPERGLGTVRVTAAHEEHPEAASSTPVPALVRPPEGGLGRGVHAAFGEQ